LEHLKVLCHLRLAKAKDRCDLADWAWMLVEQSHDPQSGRLGQGREKSGIHGFEVSLGDIFSFWNVVPARNDAPGGAANWPDWPRR
jgi:hypothetical protein